MLRIFILSYLFLLVNDNIFCQDYYSKVVEVDPVHSENPIAFEELDDCYVISGKLTLCGGCYYLAYIDKENLEVIDTVLLYGISGTGQKYWSIHEEYSFIDFDVSGVGVHKISNEGEILKSFYSPLNWSTHEANSLWDANDSTIVLAIAEENQGGPDSTRLVWLVV
ncbi:MAG: hypothetical protein AAF741_14300 [Bacteroidota bacterium]